MNTVIVNEIIEKMNNFLSETNQKLPSRGILAGQSLATVYLDVIGFDKYKTKIEKNPINDVDIFVQTDRKPRGNLFQKSGDSQLGYIGNYGRFLGVYQQDKYSLVSTAHLKNLNITHFKCTENYNSPYDLISLFDINCTQIALDLATKELYLSDNFKEFIETGELKVVDLTTSVHTIIRIAKKAKEFGFYCNIEKEFAKLSIVMKLKYFSDGYYKNYLKCKDVIDEYFTLTTVKPKIDWEDIKIDFKTDTLYTLELNTEKFMDYKAFHDVVGFGTSESIIKTAEMFYGSNIKKREEIKEVFKKTSDATWHFMSKFYFKGCSVKNFQSILKVLKQHPRLTTVYYSSSSNYKGLVEFHNNLMVLAREKGEMVFGILEGTTKKIPIEYNEMRSFIETEIKETSGELIEPSVSSFKFSHWEFRELVTSLDLILEGSKNSHCVGGYSSSVKSGYSKILSLTTNSLAEKDYTLELRLVDNNIFYISQCMAKYNKPASESLVNAFAKELKKHTSLTILTNEDFVAYREERNNRNMIKRDGVEDFTDIPF